MSIYTIYKFTNLVNGKIYVGKTINLDGRVKAHRYISRDETTVFYQAIAKYGWDNFELEIINQTAKSNEELNLLEIKYIKLLNSCVLDEGHNGYNMTRGGDGLSKGFRHSEVTKQKMSKSRKGRIFSDDHKKKLSQSKSGKNNPMYGKRGENNANFGKKHSPERVAKMTKARRGVIPVNVPRTCPHCGLIGKGGSMSRYHFDNCRRIVST